MMAVGTARPADRQLVSFVDLGRVVAEKADFASSDREQVILGGGVGLVAAEAGVHYRGMRCGVFAGRGSGLVIVARQAEFGLAGDKPDGCPRLADHNVVARSAVIRSRWVDMGRTTQQIIVATGALRGRQIHQPRVLGGRTTDRDQHKHQGCGS